MPTRFLALILVLMAALSVACGSRGKAAFPLEWPTTSVLDLDRSTTSVLERGKVQAPIFGMSVGLAEGDYFLDIDAGQSFCQVFDRIAARRSGSEIEVVVINRVVGHGVVSLCAEGYRSTEHLTVNLGRGFEAGAANTVLVNDQRLTFTAADPNAFSGNRIIVVRSPHAGDSPRTSARSGRVAKAPQPIPEQFPPLMSGERALDIDHVVVRAIESDPASYGFDIHTEFAEGCDALRRIDVRQSDKRIDVRAVSYPYWEPPRDIFLACDLIGTAMISVNLGSDFEPGVTYTVYSQGRVVAQFTAE